LPIEKTINGHPRKRVPIFFILTVGIERSGTGLREYAKSGNLCADDMGEKLD
jgi:hypothetical protein